VYSPAITELSYWVEDTSDMFVTGPDVVKTVTNETVTQEELGGASTHTRISSVADAAFANDIETLLEVRRLFSYLPLAAGQKPPRLPTHDPIDRRDDKLDTIIPDSANKPYDMREVIERSEEHTSELQSRENLVCRLLL